VAVGILSSSSLRQARMLFLLTAINLVNFMDRYITAAIQEPLGKELSLTDGELGSLAFAFVVVYMVASPIFGVLADRLTGRRPLLIAVGILLWSIATSAAAFVDTYSLLLLCRSLVRFSFLRKKLIFAGRSRRGCLRIIGSCDTI